MEDKPGPRGYLRRASRALGKLGKNHAIPASAPPGKNVTAEGTANYPPILQPRVCAHCNLRCTSVHFAVHLVPCNCLIDIKN
jgi:hypothetical protein